MKRSQAQSTPKNKMSKRSLGRKHYLGYFALPKRQHPAFPNPPLAPVWQRREADFALSAGPKCWHPSSITGEAGVSDAKGGRGRDRTLLRDVRRGSAASSSSGSRRSCQLLETAD